MAEFVEDPDWRERIAQDMRDLIDRLSGEILADAQAACPVDTGHLRESLKRGIEGTTARIGTDLNYGLYLEEGHRVAYRGADGGTHFTGDVVPPQPFLRPALYRQRGG